MRAGGRPRALRPGRAGGRRRRGRSRGRPPSTISGTCEPGLDHRGVGLGVEEDAPGVAEAEGLVLGRRRGGERAGAFGQVEDVAVPVQDGRLGREGADQRVVGVGDRRPCEADLRPLARPAPRRPGRGPGAARRGRCRAPGSAGSTASASHSRSAASSGWASRSSALIGPPIATTPSTSSWAAAARRRAASTSSTSSAAAKASRIRCGRSQDACMRSRAAVGQGAAG